MAGAEAGASTSWRGRARTRSRRFGAELKEITAKPDDTDADREERLTELADAGYYPIFVIGAAYAAAVAKVAPKYPGTWFGIRRRRHRGREERDRHPVQRGAGLLPRRRGRRAHVEDGQGRLRRRGPDPACSRGTRRASRRAPGPPTRRSRSRSRTSHGRPPPPTSRDPAEAKKAALGMYDAGADVIFGADGDRARRSSRPPTTGHWAIGVNSDQYLMSDPSVRGAILTSMLKRADVATYTITMEVANGVPKDGNNVFGLDRGGVGYSTSGGFVDPIKAQLDAFAARIASGEILVPTTP